ncbi:MAG: tRNA (N(6)-L-threonylcarbamoyladenosine(37)-C(2))-methylthiotransferase MtaB [Candidatus Magasanikbacteria bacterium CG10_big_fil_rev_8_21_14_0_10_36_32]|uniref:tRNA (N(6)-L-threonylcarbamoyladenosine(37)-C(2))-methylthiotransferase MtaB n=1 Tax=Candidatus Magasanikbacteria bacterium CG10_big_fil_rev_8_21_14_0_10_36_32 TaxID=1974646 RepID=A0A2M6W5K6_9BACT|nr:MAG: tRNA (N(6)-L-threonylcarbamoyladenosine(37)-C(2))-methylthiotransferase MtaB [Candidatus Magasanikbacteria bacterium CG10_big_fil_rev_8_21_14_0_10_36_32]
MKTVFHNMKISFYTIGCKLNQAETEELKKTLQQQGFSTVPFGKEDVCVIRACAVTCNASQTTREIIRQVKRRGTYTITVGCLENKNLPEINFIAKNNNEIIQHLQQLNKKYLCKPNKTLVTKNTLSKKTRALIKIQTGCNFNCAYCAIPSFRGRSSSIPNDEIINKIKELEKGKYKEIVLTGVNICQYNNNGLKLHTLLKKILLKTNIPRLRLGSLDPRLISDQLIKTLKNERLMPHWHLSLQSGSDSTLKRMNRGYNTKQYSKIIEKIRKINPLFSFTTDIIVGFPGETDKEFNETCAFVKKIGFTKIHIFPYSIRPNTLAETMKNHLQDKIKTERVKILTDLAQKTADEYRKKIIGLKRPILFEQKIANRWYGYSPEYLRVGYCSVKNLKNQIKIIKI